MPVLTIELRFLGFWTSVLLLITLAGGLPWTDVFGEGFKWVQKVTDTGFPKTWDARGLQSKTTGTPMDLDDMVTLARSMDLKGEVSIGLPKGEKGVYSIFNATLDFGAQKRFHFDQYSGQQLVEHDWEDVGILMKGRLWLMAFHQGEFGRWNWFLMLGIAIMLLFVGVAGLLFYLKRKQKGDWGVPKVPETLKISYGIIICIVVLGVLFPLFGTSVLLMFLWEYFKTKI